MAYLSQSSSSSPSNPVAPTPPALPKTGNYSFTVADDGVPVSFNATIGMILATLPDPASVIGRTFIAKKVDASASPINLIGNIDGMNPYSLTDEGASVVMMASATGYMIVAAYAP